MSIGMAIGLAPSARPLAAAALGLGVMGAGAQELRVGLVHIDPSVRAAGIKALNPLGAALAQPGYNATLGQATTLLLAYEQRIGERLGIELVLGLPPRHDIIGAGTLHPGAKIGSLRQLTPALMLNYHVADAGSTWQPVVGIGPLYSTLSDVKIDPAVQPHTSAKADRKWGVAAHAALGYAIDARWHLVGALGYTRVKNSLTLSTDTSLAPYPQLGLPPGIAQTVLDVKARNTTLSLTLGYRF
jgi:outer membrane protein